MPKGIKTGTKRGPYKKWVMTKEQILFVQNNSLRYTYLELADIIKVDAQKILSFQHRNNIPRKLVSRTPPAKGTYKWGGKPAVAQMSNIDRSSFTKYSNKQSVAI